MRVEGRERSYRVEGEEENEGCDCQDCFDWEERTGMTEHNRWGSATLGQQSWSRCDSWWEANGDLSGVASLDRDGEYQWRRGQQHIEPFAVDEGDWQEDQQEVSFHNQCGRRPVLTQVERRQGGWCILTVCYPPPPMMYCNARKGGRDCTPTSINMRPSQTAGNILIHFVK